MKSSNIMPKNWFKISNKVETNEVTIDIDGEIGGNWWNEGVTAESVKRDLQDMTAQLSGPVRKITVNILNSPGGSVVHAFAIYDMLTQHAAEVHTSGIGMVASSATIIFQAGDKGNRSLSANAMFLIHKPWNVAIGTAEQLEAQAKDIRTFEKRIVSIYKDTTGKTEEEITDQMNVNNGEGEWWTADKAISEGYADSQIKSMRIAASVDKEIQNRLKLPDLPKIENKMKKFIMDKFPTLAKVFGIEANNNEIEITEEMLQKSETALAEKDTTIQNLTTEKTTAVNDLATANATIATEKAAKKTAETALAAANTKIASLTTELEQVKAGKTKVEPHEDPNLSEATKNNLTAAENDAKALKE